jgi:hypothetical protein
MASHLVNDRRDLKQRALLFDAIHVIQLRAGMNELDRVLAIHDIACSTNWPETHAEIDYLISRGFLIDAQVEHIQMYDDPLPEPTSPDSPDYDVRQQSAFAVRTLACDLETPDRQAAPIFDSIDAFYFSGRRATAAADVMGIAFDAFPAPSDDTCAWQDILDFRAEMHEKKWALRRFLNTLATKQQTGAEIKDDLEWSVNEYAKAMALHNIKASQSFVDVFVITPLEILENLVTFNWSKIAKGVLQVRKRKVELMEAEMKAPGRECAYVVDAWQRFGK